MSLTKFIEKNTPNSLEECFVYQKKSGRRLIERLKNAIQKKKKIAISSSVSGCGKHTLIRLILCHMDYDMKYVDFFTEISEVIDFMNHCDVRTNIFCEKPFCLIIEDNVKKNVIDHLLKSKKNQTPMIFFKKQTNVQSFNFINVSKKRLSKYMIFKSLHFHKRLSRAAARKIISFSDSNLRTVFKLWFQSLCVVSRFKTCLKSHIKNAFSSCHQDLSSRSVLDFVKRHRDCLQLLDSSIINSHGYLKSYSFQNYLKKKDLESSVHISDLFSYLDVIDDSSNVYFRNYFFL